MACTSVLRPVWLNFSLDLDGDSYFHVTITCNIGPVSGFIPAVHSERGWENFDDKGGAYNFWTVSNCHCTCTLLGAGHGGVHALAYILTECSTCMYMYDHVFCGFSKGSAIRFIHGIAKTGPRGAGDGLVVLVLSGCTFYGWITHIKGSVPK